MPTLSISYLLQNDSHGYSYSHSRRILKGDKTESPTSAPADDGDIGLPDIDLEAVTGIACFTADTTVTVAGKGPVRMRDLQVGDSVLTASPNQNQNLNQYQPVYAFGHYLPDKWFQFVQLQLQLQGQGQHDNKNNKVSVLEMTGNHLVFTKDSKHPIRADSLKVGDVIQTSNGQTATVMRTRTVRKQGLYAPMTPDGTLVVNDNLQVSSYIAFGKHPKYHYHNLLVFFSHHDYAHMGLAPFRLGCQWFNNNNNNNRFCSHQYNEDGIPFYPELAIRVNLWLQQQWEQGKVLAPTLVFLAVVLLTGLCLVLEQVLLLVVSQNNHNTVSMSMSMMMLGVSLIMMMAVCSYTTITGVKRQRQPSSLGNKKTV